MSSVERSLERWEELASDQALVGLSDEERAELDVLVGASDLHAEIALFELAAGEVAAASFAAQDEREGLPGMLADRIQSRLTRESSKPAVVAQPVAQPIDLEARRPKPSRLPWLVAAAAIVVAIGALARGPGSKTDASIPPEQERTQLLATTGTVKIDFQATKDPAATRATGDVTWHGGLQHGFMRIDGLAPNDPTKLQYQLWIFDADRDDAFPVDGGVFDVASNERGQVIVPIKAKLAVGKPKLFAITVEKPGGVVVSKRERIVLTATPS